MGRGVDIYLNGTFNGSIEGDREGSNKMNLDCPSSQKPNRGLPHVSEAMKSISKFEKGDLICVLGQLDDLNSPVGLVLQKREVKGDNFYKVDFISVEEIEPRWVHEIDLYPLTK